MKYRKSIGVFVICTLAIVVFGMYRILLSEYAAAKSVPETERAGGLSRAKIKASGQRHSGVRIPDVLITDDQGRLLRLYSDLVRDRSVCINFFYTECDGTCPGTTMVIRKTRDELSNYFTPEELVFVSVSLAPETDSAEKLAKYRRTYGVSSDRTLPDWLFVSCSAEDLVQLRRAVGAYDPDPAVDSDRNQHAATLTFGNDRLERWSALPSGMNREQLVRSMRRILGNTPFQRYVMAQATPPDEKHGS
jgi:protein SCO1/2